MGSGRVDIELAGKVFGKLTVISKAGKTKHNSRQWLCRCECGVEKIIDGHSLRRGDSNSCGCLQRETVAKLRRSHGLSRSSEYRIWNAMKERCYNKKNKAYKNYGGRGITVCERWLIKFENFLSDMGFRPSKIHSIEREDNDGNYCKENCKWVTRDVQSRNKRSNMVIEIEGRKMILTDWAKERGILMGTITRRIKEGFTPQEAVLLLSRAEKGENHHTRKISKAQADEIRKKYNPGVYTRKMLAKEYNISTSTIKTVLNGTNL